jgi:uncharacterized protein YpmB
MKKKSLLWICILTCLVLCVAIVFYVIFFSGSSNEHWFATEKTAIKSIVQRDPSIVGVLKGTGYKQDEKVVPYYFHTTEIKHGFGIILIERKGGKYHASKASEQIGANRLSEGTNGIIEFKTPKGQKYHFSFGYQKHSNSEKKGEVNYALDYLIRHKIYYTLKELQ